MNKKRILYLFTLLMITLIIFILSNYDLKSLKIIFYRIKDYIL